MTKDQRLSTAIHIMCALAYMSPRALRSGQLAASLRANAAFVRRIMGRLAGAGLVVTGKGRQGGSRLARPASKIGMGEIYSALEERRIFKSFEKRPHKPCPISCGMKDALDKFYGGVEQAALDKMNRMTLAGFLKTIPLER